MKMIGLEEILEEAPYAFDKEKKSIIYNQYIKVLTDIHYNHCQEYRNFFDNMQFDRNKLLLEQYPFLPVRMFKEYELRSVPKEEIIKTMTSSGTTGQKVSKIYLDRYTSSLQTKVLTKIVAEFIGKKRLPMLILDSKKVVSNRQLFSARGAGILGFSMLGHHVTYALDDNMELDIKVVQEFLEKYKGQDVLVFGFTYMIWQHFYKRLLQLQSQGVRFDFSHGVMLHGGGFKKLQDEAVDNEQFKQKLFDVCNIKRVYNYYGMVEQTGSIIMECEHGNLHTSNFSDIIIRDPKDLSVLSYNEKGLIQMISILPHSYPGHSILTEDIGEIVGEDTCPCGRCGKLIRIHGRIKKAEVRGCSDTYEVKSALECKNEKIDQVFNKIDYIVGEQRPVAMSKVPYSELVIEFLDEFSKLIRQDKEALIYSDLMSLAFWCRKSNVIQLKKKFEMENKSFICKGRGLVFHITPSNVPVNSVFSYFFGLLSGNGNLVRLPSKKMPQIEIVCRILNNLLQREKFDDIRQSTAFIRYEHDDVITQKFLQQADVRIIWGGDETVRRMRALKAKSHSVEIVFSDRYSLAVIDCKKITEYTEKELGNFAHRFYNDTYFMDQNACSSPHLLLWLSNDAKIEKKAKKMFYRALAQECERYQLYPIKLVDKYTKLCEFAIEYNHICYTDWRNGVIYRIGIQALPEDVTKLRGNYGLFYEYTIKDLIEVKDVINDKVQSLMYEGVEKEQLMNFIVNNDIHGIDRIVPVGRSLDIGVDWDGYNLMGMMSRRIIMG